MEQLGLAHGCSCGNAALAGRWLVCWATMPAPFLESLFPADASQNTPSCLWCFAWFHFLSSILMCSLRNDFPNIYFITSRHSGKVNMIVKLNFSGMFHISVHWNISNNSYSLDRVDNKFSEICNNRNSPFKYLQWIQCIFWQDLNLI